MTEQTQEPVPIAFHALLVEVFPGGDMRVRLDHGFSGRLPPGETRPPVETIRPDTGCTPVHPWRAAEQLGAAAMSLIGVLQAEGLKHPHLVGVQAEGVGP